MQINKIGKGIITGTAMLSTIIAGSCAANKSVKETKNIDRAIMLDGYSAKTYAEAAINRDSIKKAGIYKKYGVTPPSSTDTEEEKFQKASEVMLKQLYAIQYRLMQINPKDENAIEMLDSIVERIKQNNTQTP